MTSPSQRIIDGNDVSYPVAVDCKIAVEATKDQSMEHRSNIQKTSALKSCLDSQQTLCGGDKLFRVKSL